MKAQNWESWLLSGGSCPSFSETDEVAKNMRLTCASTSTRCILDRASPVLFSQGKAGRPKPGRLQHSDVDYSQPSLASKSVLFSP